MKYNNYHISQDLDINHLCLCVMDTWLGQFLPVNLILKSAKLQHSQVRQNVLLQRRWLKITSAGRPRRPPIIWAQWERVASQIIDRFIH